MSIVPKSQMVLLDKAPFTLLYHVRAPLHHCVYVLCAA